MIFDYEAFNEWENKNHIPEQVKRIVNAVLKSEGYEEPFGEIDTDWGDTTNEETITIRNRGFKITEIRETIIYFQNYDLVDFVELPCCGTKKDFMRNFGFIEDYSKIKTL